MKRFPFFSLLFIVCALCYGIGRADNCSRQCRNFTCIDDVDSYYVFYTNDGSKTTTNLLQSGH
jgi:hypothetical protein